MRGLEKGRTQCCRSAGVAVNCRNFRWNSSNHPLPCAMAVRIFGLVTCALGVLLTFGILWLVKIIRVFPVKLVALGPLMVSMGVGLTIFGMGMFREYDGEEGR